MHIMKLTPIICSHWSLLDSNKLSLSLNNYQYLNKFCWCFYSQKKKDNQNIPKAKCIKIIILRKKNCINCQAKNYLKENHFFLMIFNILGKTNKMYP